jgi:hypothetical protein
MGTDVEVLAPAAMRAAVARAAQQVVDRYAGPGYMTEDVRSHAAHSSGSDAARLGPSITPSSETPRRPAWTGGKDGGTGGTAQTW